MARESSKAERLSAGRGSWPVCPEMKRLKGAMSGGTDSISARTTQMVTRIPTVSPQNAR